MGAKGDRYVHALKFGKWQHCAGYRTAGETVCTECHEAIPEGTLVTRTWTGGVPRRGGGLAGRRIGATYGYLCQECRPCHYSPALNDWQRREHGDDPLIPGCSACEWTVESRRTGGNWTEDGKATDRPAIVDPIDEPVLTVKILGRSAEDVLAAWLGGRAERIALVTGVDVELPGVPVGQVVSLEWGRCEG
jgi:hypothetical protein